MADYFDDYVLTVNEREGQPGNNLAPLGPDQQANLNAQLSKRQKVTRAAVTTRRHVDRQLTWYFLMAGAVLTVIASMLIFPTWGTLLVIGGIMVIGGIAAAIARNW